MAKPRPVIPSPSCDILFNHGYDNKPPKFNMHFHNTYEIYMLIQGDIVYHVDHNIYNMAANDIIITNSYEFHAPVFKAESHYERAYFQFNSSVISDFLSPDFDLLAAFNDRKLGCGNKVDSIYAKELGLINYL